MNADTIEVRKTDRTWSVYVNGTLVEGGFFSLIAADACADTYRRDASGDIDHDTAAH